MRTHAHAYAGEAIRLYSQAINLAPDNGAYYGNRAACWMMLSKFDRCVADCADGLRREAGSELAKLRGRQATALVHMGKLARAADVLQEGIDKGGEHKGVLQSQLTQVCAYACTYVRP